MKDFDLEFAAGEEKERCYIQSNDVRFGPPGKDQWRTVPKDSVIDMLHLDLSNSGLHIVKGTVTVLVNDGMHAIFIEKIEKNKRKVYEKSALQTMPVAETHAKGCAGQE